jgi:hypothetical protein
MIGRYSRREFLAKTARVGAAAAVVRVLPPLRPRPALGSTLARQTLDAALARMIPADGSADWSAASVGAGDYIENLLDPGLSRIYAGGPYRAQFPQFQSLQGAKRTGWSREVVRLQKLYADGLADLDARAGGSFADSPAETQDRILRELDFEGSPFFAALYDHTMEGVYSHPVYGGNANYRAWETFGYQGDVHGIRYPAVGSAGAWNEFGGYAPEEMISPGEGS